MFIISFCHSYLPNIKRASSALNCNTQRLSDVIINNATQSCNCNN